MNWFKDGDRNTAFFHVVVHKRHNAWDIFKLHHDDQVISYPKMIEDSILSSYTNFSIVPTTLDVSISYIQSFIASYITSLVTDDENNFFIKCPDLDEVKHVVFSLNGNCVPSPDVFGMLLLLMFVKLSKNIFSRLGSSLV